MKELVREILTGEGVDRKLRIAAVKLIELTLEGFSNSNKSKDAGNSKADDVALASMKNLTISSPTSPQPPTSPDRSKGKSILDREVRNDGGGRS